MSKTEDSVSQLMDEYLAALRARGYTATLDQPGPPAQRIRADLTEAGYGSRDEVTEFFSWAHYPVNAESFWLFEYYAHPFSLSEAIDCGSWYRNMWFEDWAGDIDPVIMIQDRMGRPVPGADRIELARWLPLTMGVDSADLMMIDTSDDPEFGGSIWLTTKSSYVRAFDTLSEAIGAAIVSVERGVWTINRGVEIDWPGRRAGQTFAGSPDDQEWIDAIR